LAILNYLKIDQAHLAGISMGGMIAQTLALTNPERVKSLTSIMSTTGRRRVGYPHPRLVPSLIRPRKSGREAYIANSQMFWRLIGSPQFPPDQALSEANAAKTFDRGFSQSGVLRQMIAIVNQPDRTKDLRQLQIPTVVLHGKTDILVDPSGGKATAAAIPGAELFLVPGLGHDLPAELFPLFVDAISLAAVRATKRPGS
jgi:pimeloyl-ACP methyl ester carboxylesterase